MYKRQQQHHTDDPQVLFGIVQGAFFEDLRIESARTLADMDFFGYGIGGLSVGEPKPMMYDPVSYTHLEVYKRQGL